MQYAFLILWFIHCYCYIGAMAIACSICFPDSLVHPLFLLLLYWCDGNRPLRVCKIIMVRYVIYEIIIKSLVRNKIEVAPDAGFEPATK